MAAGKLNRDGAVRLPSFVGGPGDPGAVLAESTVVLVGLGSVGRAANDHLARAGIGSLQLVDRGFIKEASVFTHPVGPEEIGEPKAEVARSAALSINPGARIDAYQADFRDLPLDELDGSVLLLAVDNLETEIAVTQFCLARGIPLVQAAVHGATMVAQVRTVTGGDGGEGPCLVCQFSDAEWAQVASEPRYACDGSAQGQNPLGPTRSISSLCSLAAELAVHAILRHLLGLGRPMADQLLEYRGYTDELVRTGLQRNPRCPVDHRRWERLDIRGAVTLEEVLRSSGADSSASVSADGRKFLTEAACTCGRWVPVGRFVAPDEPLGSCPACQGNLEPSPFHSLDSVPVAQLGARVDQPLDALGIDAGRALLVRSAEGRTTLATARGRCR